MNISVIGTGNVGRALCSAFVRLGHDVRAGSRNPAQAAAIPGVVVASVGDCVAWGEIVFLAVPFTALGEVVKTVGAERFAGKLVVDVSNVLDSSWEWALGFTTSGAEELAKKIPEAKVVKAFNTVFAEHMSTGVIGGEKATLFVAGDDEGAKLAITELGRGIGFDVVDAGALKSARFLEPLGLLMITLGYHLKMGSGIGLKLIRK